MKAIQNHIGLSVLLICIVSCGFDKNYTLMSPDRNIELIITDQNGRIELVQLFNGDTIIRKAILGLRVDSSDLTQSISIKTAKYSTYDTTWNTINGKNSRVRNHYNQIVLFCEVERLGITEYKIWVRCFNDGFAFRYMITKPEKEDSISINEEYSRFWFSEDCTFWAYNGENHNIGPESLSNTSLEFLRIPVVLQTEQGYFYGIHEAAILRYAPFRLKIHPKSRSLSFQIPPARDKGEITSSWRAVIISEEPGKLVESDLLANLNEPCNIEDPSWIKPGKTLWDWRVWGYTAPDGFVYGSNTASHKRFIDFASENNIQYLIMDANWYGDEFSEHSDPRIPEDDIDMGGTIKYAKEKGIGIILYVNDIGIKKFGLESCMSTYAQWGISGIKYGFMKGTPEEEVKYSRQVIETCAKFRLMLNFHDDPVPPSGDRRTYPNVMTKEFGHAQADPHNYYPETIVTSPFVNMIAGPLDQTNGFFDLNSAHIGRHRVRYELPGTVAAEVAKLIVIYTGWMVLPDCPEEYARKDDLFEAVREMPPQFDSFKVLSGKIGEYITVLRRGGGKWFIGSLTNRKGRALNIDLGFLPEDCIFTATIYEDTDSTNFIDNKESYRIRKLYNIGSDTVLSVNLAPGGGNTIILEHQSSSDD